MASPSTATLLALLMVVLPMTALGTNSSTPFLDSLCNDVNCGKGTCQVDVGQPFGYTCQCQTGWKRTRLDSDDGLLFLPCVIPNCTMDYSCMPAPPPMPPFPYNYSAFDPCYWIYCGEGTCTKIGPYAHSCQCDSGYYNLLNISIYPCYSNCAIGSDCSKLGIKVESSSSTPSSGNDGNYGKTNSSINIYFQQEIFEVTASELRRPSSILPGMFYGITILLISMAVLLGN
ncbi:hypothetical protein RJ641_020547 [Dillenia turbinata]|uniref:EGF-like domain-containing protein n=1 Tax=Dillenia turbinata TaxID=194707 RepID=A0AAN8UH63_9MAGN